MQDACHLQARREVGLRANGPPTPFYFKFICVIMGKPQRDSGTQPLRKLGFSKGVAGTGFARSRLASVPTPACRVCEQPSLAAK